MTHPYASPAARPANNARMMNSQRYDFIEKLSEQVTGGTQRHLRTVAVFRPWRGWEGSAAPDLPGRRQGYSMQVSMSIVWLPRTVLRVSKSDFLLASFVS